jgi:hypothetical protein
MSNIYMKLSKHIDTKLQEVQYDLRNKIAQPVQRLSYGLDDPDSIPAGPMMEFSFSSPLHPHWLWGPSSLLSKGYQGLSPQR